MRFLVDESFPARLAAFLKTQGHDVTRVGSDLPHGMPDEDVLATASNETRILITDDTDFGELIHRRGLAHAGVILFRLGYAPLPTRITLLERVLHHHVDELERFIVVTRTRIRVS